MKKSVKTLLAAACAATVCVSAFALVACGETESKSAPAVKEQYTCFTQEKVLLMGSLNTTVSSFYTLNILDNGTYEYTIASDQSISSGSMATTTVTLKGKYEKSKPEDNLITVTLKKADDVIYTMYTKMGGASLHINTTNKNQKYPCELPARTQGEKRMAKNKAEVIADFSAEPIVVYVNTEAEKFPNQLMLTMPDAPQLPSTPQE